MAGDLREILTWPVMLTPCTHVWLVADTRLRESLSYCSCPFCGVIELGWGPE